MYLGWYFLWAQRKYRKETCGRRWKSRLRITARWAKSANSLPAAAPPPKKALFFPPPTGCVAGLFPSDPFPFFLKSTHFKIYFRSIQSNYPSPRLPLEALAKWGGRVLGEGASGGGLLSLTDRHLYVIKAGSRFRIQHEPCVNRDQLHDRLADFEKHLGRKGDSGL